MLQFSSQTICFLNYQIRKLSLALLQIWNYLDSDPERSYTSLIWAGITSLQAKLLWPAEGFTTCNLLTVRPTGAALTEFVEWRLAFEHPNVLPMAQTGKTNLLNKPAEPVDAIDQPNVTCQKQSTDCQNF